MTLDRKTAISPLYLLAVACLAMGTVGNLFKTLLPKALAAPAHFLLIGFLGLAAILFICVLLFRAKPGRAAGGSGR